MIRFLFFFFSYSGGGDAERNFIFIHHISHTHHDMSLCIVNRSNANAFIGCTYYLRPPSSVLRVQYNVNILLKIKPFHVYTCIWMIFIRWQTNEPESVLMCRVVGHTISPLWSTNPVSMDEAWKTNETKSDSMRMNRGEREITRQPGNTMFVCLVYNVLFDLCMQEV